MSNAQNVTHTTSGINNGKNIVSDCCTKIATTPIKPKINPIPFTNVIEAFSSVLCFSIFDIGILNVYDSMFLQLEKTAKKYARSCLLLDLRYVRKMAFFLSEFVEFFSYTDKSTLQTCFRSCKGNRINPLNLSEYDYAGCEFLFHNR